MRTLALLQLFLLPLAGLIEAPKAAAPAAMHPEAPRATSTDVQRENHRAKKLAADASCAPRERACSAP